jgi:hypothetical protein
MDSETKLTVANALAGIFLLITIGFFIMFGQAEEETAEQDTAGYGCCTSIILLVIFGSWAKKLQDADNLEKELETARNMQDAEKERLRVEREAEEARKEAEKEAERRKLRKEIEELEEALL